MRTEISGLVLNTSRRNKRLTLDVVKKYEGNTVMQEGDKRRLKEIEFVLDKKLSKLDKLRCETEEEEKSVLELIHEQRLIKEKLK